ncbi:MAG TPA: nickel-dependent hydrogenase large subunit [Noviherbaspirillum sp.]|uniref:nickel-dependent hydrogenase large subunit n=1 Tax=Noviherbaspirillum sp. TaxID=1926288 RepID=UPI002B4900E5|nr:nickel-dependent hydrogenase large subunit [Noviherbaspirillum sp.]HJV84597.1 nickel-dependent hydrogenase large subunit [Noviherbaspirillum sp.]
MPRVEVNLELNRVEGDLTIGVTLEDGVVVDAKTVGHLYRGFEQILIGRTPRDAMVITPRICGICSTVHLYAAVLALEQAWQLPVPANAVRIRDLCLMAEGIQSDLRQTFLFFAPDFCNPRYREHVLFDDVMAAFEPFKGAMHREALAITRRAVELIAHFGGQWPHSSYMLPGGVASPPDMRRILACQAVLDEVSRWYETRVIGASLEQWLALNSAPSLYGWLDQEGPANSALGLMSRFMRSIGLHQLGAGTPHMISFAGIDPLLRASTGAGFYDADIKQVLPLDQGRINEHVRYSWFRQYAGGRHPYEGETVPLYQPASDRYTWAKAPRYADKVVQTGPLAELFIGGDALIRSLHESEGDSAWLRQLARIRRTAFKLVRARQLLKEMAAHLNEPHFLSPPAHAEKDGQGCGLIMAPRGALGHWVKIRNGVIDKYQIITPTAWNASPRDSAGEMGHWERSLIGLRVADPDDPVEVGHVIRSHDPCLVCSVHFLGSGRRVRYAA